MDNSRIAKASIALSGRTQRDVALAAGMDETKLSRIVNGRHPGDAVSREAIATALGRTVAELFPEHAPDATSPDASDEQVAA